MTQVEIARKILEQGNCNGMDCKDNCPFYDKINSGWNTNCVIWIKNKINIFDRDMDKVKQWLKEQEKEMINLNVNQIVNPAIKGFARDYDYEEFVERELHIIDSRFLRKYITDEGSFKQFVLQKPKPTKKFKPWLKVEDVPVSLWGKVLYKHKGRKVEDAEMMSPRMIANGDGNIYADMTYLPLGQPLTGEWLEMGEWV